MPFGRYHCGVNDCVRWVPVPQEEEGSEVELSFKTCSFFQLAKKYDLLYLPGRSAIPPFTKLLVTLHGMV